MAKPTDSIMSTPTDGAPVTAASTATAEVIDSITDTDTTDTAVSGAGQADKPPTLTSDTSNSNFRVSPANSKTTAMRTWHDDVNVDVTSRPRPSQADRPQRTRRIPARLLSYVHVHWGESEFSFGRQSPSCSVVLRSLQCSISNTEASQLGVMSDKETPITMDESSTSESESLASSPSIER